MAEEEQDDSDGDSGSSPIVDALKGGNGQGGFGRNPIEFGPGEDPASNLSNLLGRTRAGETGVPTPHRLPSYAAPDLSGVAPHFGGDVETAISNASMKSGVSEDTLRRFIKIESSGRPDASTGSYHGLLQLSNSEFNKYGGGNIFSANDNALAGAYKIRAESEAFQQRYGRPPTTADLYMIHQQGAAGAAAHWDHPELPAWQNMASTGEGRQKGEAWAKKAIWGNVPDNLKAQYGSVEQMTSQQFTDMWAAKIGGESSLVLAQNGPKPSAGSRNVGQLRRDPYLVASADPSQSSSLGAKVKDKLRTFATSFGSSV